MIFETEAETLKWYESEDRVLNKIFLDTIPWHTAKDHPLSDEFVPILLYMRDIERFTSMYYEELKRTSTVKDPSVRTFMDRWATEETLHADLLNRFLNEAGHPTSDDWYEKAKAKLPPERKYWLWAQESLARVCGKHFVAVHMTFGAINELTTLNGYERLRGLAKHPLLAHILNGIMREEARHGFFYWNIARIKLLGSSFRRGLSRFLVERFWKPVGEGEKSVAESNYVIATLFRGLEGIKTLDERVTRRIAQLPGFDGVCTVTDRIEEISLKA